MFSKFVQFKIMVENQFDLKIKMFRSDNGTEFVNLSMTTLLAQHGILHQKSCPYTPQRNGIGE